MYVCLYPDPVDVLESLLRPVLVPPAPDPVPPPVPTTNPSRLLSETEFKASRWRVRVGFHPLEEAGPRPKGITGEKRGRRMGEKTGGEGGGEVWRTWVMRNGGVKKEEVKDNKTW